MTVLLLERYPVDPAHVAAFEEHMGHTLDAMRAADGNLWADMARATDDAPSFLLLSEWRDEVGADAWARGADARLTDPYLRADRTIRRFTSP